VENINKIFTENINKKEHPLESKGPIKLPEASFMMVARYMVLASFRVISKEKESFRF